MSIRSPKATIIRSTNRRKNKKTNKAERVRGFRYKLKGTNGESLGTSQFYTRKESAIDTLAKYHPNFDVIDGTIKKKKK